MGKRKGRKLTRRVKKELRDRKSEDRGQKAEDWRQKVKIKLPPLSEDGLRAALGVTTLERVEQIRRA